MTFLFERPAEIIFDNLAALPLNKLEELPNSSPCKEYVLIKINYINDYTELVSSHDELDCQTVELNRRAA